MGNLRQVNKVIKNVATPTLSFNTEVLDLTDLQGYSIQVICTSTLACTVSLAGSNQVLPFVTGSDPFMTVISDSTIAIPAGTSFMYNVSDVQYKYAQVQVSALSGAGQMTIIYNAKAN